MAGLVQTTLNTAAAARTGTTALSAAGAVPRPHSRPRPAAAGAGEGPAVELAGRGVQLQVGVLQAGQTGPGLQQRCSSQQMLHSRHSAHPRDHCCTPPSRVPDTIRLARRKCITNNLKT